MSIDERDACVLTVKCFLLLSANEGMIGMPNSQMKLSVTITGNKKSLSAHSEDLV